MNLMKLKGKLTENSLTYSQCAKQLNISTTSFSGKMKGKYRFTVPEANELANYLLLSNEEKLSIFFEAELACGASYEGGNRIGT